MLPYDMTVADSINAQTATYRALGDSRRASDAVAKRYLRLTRRIKRAAAGRTYIYSIGDIAVIPRRLLQAISATIQRELGGPRRSRTEPPARTVRWQPWAGPKSTVCRSRMPVPRPPAAGGPGSNWKLIYEIGGGTDANVFAGPAERYDPWNSWIYARSGNMAISNMLWRSRYRRTPVRPSPCIGMTEFAVWRVGWR